MDLHAEAERGRGVGAKKEVKPLVDVGGDQFEDGRCIPWWYLCWGIVLVHTEYIYGIDYLCYLGAPKF